MLENLQVGETYYCAVTAYNADDLESAYSEEISFIVAPPEAPVSGGDDDGDGLSNLFEASYSSTGELEAEADLNGDGLPVLAEFVHGLDPLSPHNRAFSRLEFMEIAGERYLCIRYQIDPMAESLATLHVERSIDLSDPNGWTRNGTTVVSSQELADGSGLVEVVTRSLYPMSSLSREFLRFAYEPSSP